MIPAFVLHQRAYRETSLLIELLTLQDGRMRVIAKGAKRPKSPLRPALQSFTPLRVAYTPRGELRTLTHCELEQTPFYLQAEALYAGFYLNELLMALLPQHAECEDIFALYHMTLADLCTPKPLATTLRFFEKKLIEQLGYGINFSADIQHAPIDPLKHYAFTPAQGFSLTIPNERSFPGHQLLHIHHNELNDAQTQLIAKQILRTILADMLGNKPLRSRFFYATPTQPEASSA